MPRGWGSVARVAVAGLMVTCVFAGCAGLRPRAAPHTASFHISDHRHEGDAARRASTELVLMGLDDDISGRSQRALSQYERALQVDPNNPYAYLALARHFADSADPRRGAPYLDRAEALIILQETPNAAVQVHLLGLRGQVGSDGSPGSEASRRHLAEAARASPEFWGDGRLSADELF